LKSFVVRPFTLTKLAASQKHFAVGHLHLDNFVHALCSWKIFRGTQIVDRKHGRWQRGPCPTWIFIHDTDKVKKGLMVYFSVLFFPLPPLENFLPTSLAASGRGQLQSAPCRL